MPGDDSANQQFGTAVRASLLRLLYLAAIAVVMIGWVWMLAEGITWAANSIDLLILE
jgi:hypothetical protein